MLGDSLEGQTGGAYQDLAKRLVLFRSSVKNSCCEVDEEVIAENFCIWEQFAFRGVSVAFVGFRRQAAAG